VTSSPRPFQLKNGNPLTRGLGNIYTNLHQFRNFLRFLFSVRARIISFTVAFQDELQKNLNVSTITVLELLSVNLPAFAKSAKKLPTCILML